MDGWVNSISIDLCVIIDIADMTKNQEMVQWGKMYIFVNRSLFLDGFAFGIPISAYLSDEHLESYCEELRTFPTYQNCTEIV